MPRPVYRLHLGLRLTGKSERNPARCGADALPDQRQSAGGWAGVPVSGSGRGLAPSRPKWTGCVLFRRYCRGHDRRAGPNGRHPHGRGFLGHRLYRNPTRERHVQRAGTGRTPAQRSGCHRSFAAEHPQEVQPCQHGPVGVERLHIEAEASKLAYDARNRFHRRSPITRPIRLGFWIRRWPTGWRT